jgi:hypothetical protein
MLHGASVKDVRSIYQSEYSITTKDLDHGNYIPSCVYMHKCYFKYNGEYVPQDYSKAGKAVSIYNRMRGQSQSGANVRLFWTIDLADGLRPNYLEKKFHQFAWRHNASNDAFGTELYLLDTKESFNILNEFIKTYNLKEDPRIQRISVFNGANRSVIFENKEAHDIDYSKNEFDKLFEMKDD